MSRPRAPTPTPPSRRRGTPRPTLAGCSPDAGLSPDGAGKGRERKRLHESRLHLGCISAASRLHLGCISAASRLPLAGGHSKGLAHSGDSGSAPHASSFAHDSGQVSRIQTPLESHSPSVPQYQQLPSCRAPSFFSITRL